jgi:cell division protein FtsI/penicillin-binding protein 2
MYVVIDEPRGKFYGGDVAAPLFKLIAERLMIYLEIFPETDGRNEIRI